MPDREPIIVHADADFRQLLDDYRRAKADASEAAKRADDAAAELKMALIRYAPGSNSVAVDGYGQTVRLTLVETTRLDSKRLKADLGPLIDTYSKTSTSWRLAEDRG